MSAFDLDAYLARIGWSGPVVPTLETLTGLIRAHIARIPFENLDVLLGRGVSLDLDRICSKMVAEGRGGYCFEHGALFQAALTRIGFRSVAHAARVLTVLPRELAPRTHMFLTVEIGRDRFMVDPGFGGRCAVVPVPVRDGVEVRDGVDRHRLVRSDGEWVLETEADGKMAPLWISTLEPQLPIDFELANHWIATAAESPFVNKLILRAVTPEGRTSVVNRDVSVSRGSVAQKYALPDRRALRTLLRDDFGFDLPEIEQLRVPHVPEWT